MSEEKSPKCDPISVEQFVEDLEDIYVMFWKSESLAVAYRVVILCVVRQNGYVRKTLNF